MKVYIVFKYINYAASKDYIDSVWESKKDARDRMNILNINACYLEMHEVIPE